MNRISPIFLLALLLAACGQKSQDESSADSPKLYEGSSTAEVEPIITGELMEDSEIPHPEVTNCVECHQEQFGLWIPSQHANANRLVSLETDRPGFDPPQTTKHGTFTNTAAIEDDEMVLTTTDAAGNTSRHVAEAVIGVEPLIQYLVPFGNGRLQVMDVAYDPANNEWFNIYGDQDRQPHEWGYWKNRSMTWNGQCAFCHMTELDKNYNVETDTYHTKWRAMGINCIQCHGDMTDHMKNPEAPLAGYPRTDEEIMHNCASCHSRREQLQDGFRSGDNYYDHFRLVVGDNVSTYYQDGQVRDEDFEYGSFIGSRMHQAGVNCRDCHDPHSGKLILPAENNSLCMSCHAAPGRDGAIPIDMELHSHHAPDNKGFQCIECHMAETTYMARDPRRDHGFVIPDPVLTKELGIPNSCNRCHDEKSTDWAIEWTDKWYGEKMERRSRQRARVIARAQTMETDVPGDLIEMIESEDIPWWKATLINLLSHYSGRAGAREVFVASLEHEHPLVRSAGVQALAPFPDVIELVTPLLDDPARVVRVDAEWIILNRGGKLTDAQRKELMTYLDFVADQPAGASRQAQLALVEGRNEDAIQWIEKLVAWDPSPGAYHTAGQFHYQAGDLKKTEEAFLEALKQEPDEASVLYSLSLLYAEMGRGAEAMQTLEKVTEADPGFARAWYNLGLSYAADEQLSKAVAALREAEKLMPNSPDPTYARATVHLRMKEPDKARQAARKALRISPGHPQATGLLQQLR